MAVQTPPSGSGTLLQSVQRAAHVLRVIARERRALTTRELSEIIGTNRSTCYHLVNTLVHEDLLRRDPHGRLLLGFGVSELFDALTDMLTPDEHLLDAVNMLNERTGETSYVGVWDGPDIVTVAVRAGFRSVRVRNVALGYRSHVHLRAIGRALLAFRDDDYLTAYLGRTPLEALTPHSVTDADALRALLREVRDECIAVESEEFILGVCCVAAPIVASSGEVTAAVCVSVPKARFDADGANIVATVKEVAGTATQVLQGQSLRRGMP